jgi:hypothetical protein
MVADVSGERAVYVYMVYQCNKVNFVCFSNRNMLSALKLELAIVFLRVWPFLILFKLFIPVVFDVYK